MSQDIDIVSCSGDEDPSARHPKVYLHFKDAEAVCPYCGKLFRPTAKKEKDGEDNIQQQPPHNSRK